MNLSVYSISGQKAHTLVSDYKTYGTYRIVWDGKDDSGMPVASGICFARMESWGKVASARLLLMK